MPVQMPDAAVYAGDPLNPVKIWDNLEQARLSWTTIVLALFHIGNDDQGWTIYFNDYPVIVDGKVVEMFADWNNPLSQLLQGGSVRKIYASIGGGEPVKDFQTISDVYYNNGKSFKNTLLEINLKEFRSAFPAITGIDMDIEEGFDDESFFAFCKLVHDLGYDISFCPFGSYDDHNQNSMWFLTDMLERIEKSDWGKGAVKRFNVQYYFSGAYGSSKPRDIVEKIKSKLPDFDTTAFISVGCWARSKNNRGEWQMSCPPDIANTIAYYNQNALESICGGFIWNLDCIFETSLDSSGCSGYAFQGDYRNAIFDGLVKKWKP